MILNRRSKQTGLSLVSLMISLVIGMFLLFMLFSMWQSTRGTFTTEGTLAKLQGQQRLALTIMANTVRNAGYYPFYLNYQTPAPTTPYTTTSFTSGGSFQTGQFLLGTYSAAAPGDTLTVRFIADGNTLDCLGQQEVAGTLVTNYFSVSNGNLQCAVNGASAQTIASGVSNLSILYGVDSIGDLTPHQYLNANAVTTNGQWLSVLSVQIQLTFNNPLSGQQGQLATLAPLRRTVALLQTLS